MYAHNNTNRALTHNVAHPREQQQQRNLDMRYVERNQPYLSRRVREQLKDERVERVLFTRWQPVDGREDVFTVTLLDGDKEYEGHSIYKPKGEGLPPMIASRCTALAAYLQRMGWQREYLRDSAYHAVVYRKPQAN